ncbi:MAG TPA: phospho-sugar mutase [Clostridia bacterium]|jgi:phosphoglucomutase|nr:phospho-sugar mutase [Clostridia bacterium]
MYNQRYDEWLGKVTPAEREELLGMSDNEKKERFSLELAFGTAGMRGELGMGTFRMNIYNIRRATMGLAKYICDLGKDAMKKGVVISYDTRRFSREFALAVAEVLSYYKVNSFIFEDVRPVPICSYAIREIGTIAGVMITASHNPKEYNGYKVYGEDGAQMSPEATAVVVKYIKEQKDYFAVPYEKIDFDSFEKGAYGKKLNKYTTIISQDIDEGYYQELEKLMLSPEIVKAKGKDIKLVYTPIHGSGYIPVTTMFKRLGINAHVVEAQKYPDTEFSTVPAPNPENPKAIAMGIEEGNKIGADVVLGTDPDADRLGVAVRNDEGEFILLTGNQIGIMLLDYIITRRKEKGTLPKNAALVKTIVTSTLADRIAEANGVTVFNVLTGFKFIGEKMTEWAETGEYTYIFGFEESFGSLCGTYARDKDAVVASVMFAEMLLYLENKGSSVYKRLMEIMDEYGYYTEKNSAAAYKGLSGMETMAKVMAKVRGMSITEIAGEEVLYVADYLSGAVKYANGSIGYTGLPESNVIYLGLEDEQFICIRPSGTEPQLKIYVLVYADTKEKSQAKADKLMAAVKEMLQ